MVSVAVLAAKTIEEVNLAICIFKHSFLLQPFLKRCSRKVHSVVAKIFSPLGFAGFSPTCMFLMNIFFINILWSFALCCLTFYVMAMRLLLRNGLLETICRKEGRRANNRTLKDNSDEDAEKEVSKIGNKGIWRSLEWERAGNGGRNWASEAADRFITFIFLR